MNKNNLINSLKNLNNAQRGSLGEFIFYQESRKQGFYVESLHEQRIDFIIDGEIFVDVKTTFEKYNFILENSTIGIYHGKLEKGIHYALVELFSDGIRISIDRSPFSEISLELVKNYLDSWISKNKKFSKNTLWKKNLSEFEPIQNEIVAFFNINYALNARVIYRTVQKGFGKESPDNLVPKSIHAQNISVYIDFRNKRISKQNINRIVAFPDVCSTTFPKIKKPTLHHEKIDIDALDPIYKFRDVEDLFKNFQSRFKEFLPVNNK